MVEKCCFSSTIVLVGVLFLTFCDGCMQTIPVEDITDVTTTTTTTTTTAPMCIDPSLLFNDPDLLQRTTLSRSGPQPIGTVVTAKCAPGDSIFVVHYDDGTVGRSDDEAGNLLSGIPAAKRIEIMTLTCDSNAKWFTTVMDDFDSCPLPLKNPIVTSGTVSRSGAIRCRQFFLNNVPIQAPKYCAYVLSTTRRK